MPWLGLGKCPSHAPSLPTRAHMSCVGSCCVSVSPKPAVCSGVPGGMLRLTGGSAAGRMLLVMGLDSTSRPMSFSMVTELKAGWRITACGAVGRDRAGRSVPRRARAHLHACCSGPGCRLQQQCRLLGTCARFPPSSLALTVLYSYCHPLLLSAVTPTATAKGAFRFPALSFKHCGVEGWRAGCNWYQAAKAPAWLPIGGSTPPPPHVARGGDHGLLDERAAAAEERLVGVEQHGKVLELGLARGLAGQWRRRRQLADEHCARSAARTLSGGQMCSMCTGHAGGG